MDIRSSLERQVNAGMNGTISADSAAAGVVKDVAPQLATEGKDNLLRTISNTFKEGVEGWQWMLNNPGQVAQGIKNLVGGS